MIVCSRALFQRRSLMAVVVVMLVALSVVAAAAQGFGGGRPGGGGGRMGGGRLGGLGLLRDEAVQKELKMTPAQVAKAEAKQQEVRQQMMALRPSGGSIRNLSPQDRQKLMEKLRSVQEKAIADVLTPGQRPRFHQLQLQREGPIALLRPDVATQLKLTSAQRKSLIDIQQKTMGQARTMFAGMNPRTISDADRQKIRAFQQTAQQKMLTVLTPAQVKQWKQMQGKPFHFSPPRGRA